MTAQGQRHERDERGRREAEQREAVVVEQVLWGTHGEFRLQGATTPGGLKVIIRFGVRGSFESET